LEHGGGIGTFSELLLNEALDRLVVVEPAANLLPALRERLAPGGGKVEIVGSTLEEAADRLRHQPVDTVVSINVMEHIQDDMRTLRSMWEVLVDGGRIILYVPALPWLYGTLDKTFQHIRRYRRQELRAKVSAAGFRVVLVRFMNLLGVASWLVAGRILRQSTLSRRAVAVYDHYIVPVLERLEGLHPPPIGQNLLLIGEKHTGKP